jgi:hypothetical protein
MVTDNYLVAGVSGQSTQPTLLVTYNQQLPTGTLIEIRDASGNTLLDYTAKTAFLMSGFTSPGFAIGKTYSLYINRGKVRDITLNSVITTIGDNRFNLGWGRF